ncbi:MAG: hypothetical protein QF577_07670 [Phycisphaerae bacterium]|nr:hypothetical protein [Phycisphaerae bacterium]MDP7637410.1 hypothetical protein [Phycisphaerae bacterium]
MSFRRYRWARSMILAGSGLLLLGIILLLVKLTMILAWHAAGAVALAGLVFLLIGLMLRG